MDAVLVWAYSVGRAVGHIMQSALAWYTDWRTTLDFDTVEYGGLGVHIAKPENLSREQVGFLVSSCGESLAGVRPGDWRPEWMVIGHNTWCGDPIFTSRESPHLVFTAMHGEGSCTPKLVAPTIGLFGQCLKLFKQFAARRSSPADLEANPPTLQEQSQFLQQINGLTDGDKEPAEFWAVLIDVDLDAFN